MTSEQPPKDALRPLRPLPSIDIPLLREERSAVRSRRFVRLVLGIAALFGLAAVTAISVFAHKPRNTDEAPQEDLGLPEEAASPAESAPVIAVPQPARPKTGAGAATTPPMPARTSDVGPVVDPRAVSRTQHTFGRALSFRDALEKNGLSRNEASAVVAGLGPVMDFRRSQPEDTLTFERGSDGTLVRFEYRSGLTQRFEARRTEAGNFLGRQIQVPIRRVRVAKGGTVDGSLGDALEGLKLGRSLAGVFAEVFEGHISFSSDTRAGDTFRIIFDEEYVEDNFLRYGDVHALEYKGSKAGHLLAFWYETKSVDGDFYDANGRAMHGGWLRTPLHYDHISSGFGMRFHPVLKRKQLHNGIDYAAGTGTPVRAAASGVITFIGPKGPNGNLIAISHAQGFETYYAHLSRFAPGLKRGNKVQQRQLIAYVGSTGRSTGPHLHFSLKKSGRFIDPASQLNGPGLPMPAKDVPDYKRNVREWTEALDRTPIERPVPVASSTPQPAAEDLGEEEL